MGKKRKQLSQAEIWDDSALLDSWNEALAEYKLYHSIHARRERVEDVIEAAESGAQDEALIEEPAKQAAVFSQINDALSEDLEDGELEEEIDSAEHLNTGNSNGEIHEPGISQSEQMQHPPKVAEGSTKEGHQDKAAMPGSIMDGVKDDSLKNLMMSWYYAGYYTGLYEGQQQARNIPPRL